MFIDLSMIEIDIILSPTSTAARKNIERGCLIGMKSVT